MFNDFLFSVITVGLNESEIIDTLLPLTSSSSLAHFEIIVVTPFISDNLRGSLPSASFISDPGNGVYSAMNMALRFASGAYVWFLNAGDKSSFDHISINTLIRDLRTIMHNYPTNKLPILFFGECFLSNRLRLCNHLFLKLTLLSLGMPISHQNILIPLSAHKPFTSIYRYSSDYFSLMSLIFKNNVPFVCRPFKLALLVPGGISDLNRYSVLSERLLITVRLFSYIYSPTFLVVYILRLLREALASTSKTILAKFISLRSCCLSLFGGS